MKDPAIGFSLVAGGPFYRVLRAARLVQPGRFRALRPAIAVVIGGWFPLMAIALTGRFATGEFNHIVLDLSMHARMLLAVPLFFAGEEALEFQGNLAIDRFRRGGFAEPDGHEAVQRALAKAERRRDHPAPELLLLLVAWSSSAAMLVGAISPPGSIDATADVRALSSVWIWCDMVVLPIFKFLLGRWLWRWLIWSMMLFDISRIDLRLMPTHPDHSGGIAHLTNPIGAFSLFVCGLSTTVAAAWYSRIALGQVRVVAILPALFLFLIAVEVVALAPMLVFIRNLSRARRKGVTEYGLLSLHLMRLFDRRWIERPADDSMLDRQDVSALADMMSSYAGVVQMRLVPFTHRAAIAVPLAVLVPMLPVVTAEVPLPQLLAKVLQALLT